MHQVIGQCNKTEQNYSVSFVRMQLITSQGVKICVDEEFGQIRWFGGFFVSIFRLLRYNLLHVWWENKQKIKSLPLGANLSISPARKEISSSERALKSYSALPTTWSSSPLAQLLDTVLKQKSQVYLLWVTKFCVFFKGKWRKHFNFHAKFFPVEKWQK